MGWKIFYNPLEVLGKGGAFVAAIAVVAVITMLACWGQVHLDGALDLHVGAAAPIGLVAVESLADWLCLGIFLFIASKLLGGNGDIVGHLAAAGLGRFPYVISILLAARQFATGSALRAIASISEGKVVVDMVQISAPAVIFVLLITALATFWSISMLYCGFKTESRLEIGKAIVAFVIGLVLAEAVSKLLLQLAFRHLAGG